MPGTGRELAAAGLGNLWLSCQQVPAEEGEGQGAAFPVPPARLDLRGLRLPGNSRAAAGPGSARGLLGAGPERFETTGLGHQENLALADVKEKKKKIKPTLFSPGPLKDFLPLLFKFKQRSLRNNGRCGPRYIAGMAADGTRR